LRYSEVGYLNVIVVTQWYLCIFSTSSNRNDLDEEIGRNGEKREAWARSLIIENLL